jgi:hypothetical protein
MWTAYDVQPTDARPSTSYSKSANDLWANELKTSGCILELLHRNHNIWKYWGYYYLVSGHVLGVFWRCGICCFSFD